MGFFFLRSLPSCVWYPQVVDVEWTKQKSKDPNYGNKKGWFAVCELMPPYHSEEIAGAGDGLSEIRELYCINQEFYDCVLAAPAEIQTRPLIKLGDQEAPK